MTTVPACALHPDRPALTVCRRCGNFTCVECNPDGRTECPSCRALTGSRFTRGLVPWERRGELGLFSALWLQTKETILEPTRMWATLDPKGPALDALLYAWLISAFASLGQIPYNALTFWLQTQQLDEVLQKFKDDAPGDLQPVLEVFGWFLHHPGLAALGLGLYGLIGFPVAIVLQACLSHVGAMAVGLRRHDFVATLRSVAYAQGSNVLLVIPIVGGFVGLYTLVLEIWALRDAHEGTTGRAIIATLWPTLLLVCCACGGGVLAILAAVGAGSATH